jgi:microcystin-dependent protein
MALTTKADGGLALTGTGESSFAGGLRILTGSNPVRFTSAWSNFPNEGGADAKRNQAEISNDTSDYKALMIVGNRSNDKAVRRVQVWDRLEVQGSLKVTGTIEVEGHILGKDALVKGLIMMWYGEVAAIPAGWVLCDGTHETPDLRGRFVVGYHPDDVDYKVRGNKGGAKTHTLTLEEMPAHAHNGSTSSSTLSIPRGGGAGGSNALASTNTNGWAQAEFSHSHTLTTDSRGGGKAFDHRPPYYVLAFIMYTGG